MVVVHFVAGGALVFGGLLVGAREELLEAFGNIPDERLLSGRLVRLQ